jgi:signal transduction histidine kinase/ActR/RegA family two-component response regulator
VMRALPVIDPSEDRMQPTTIASSNDASVRYTSVRRRVIALGILVLVGFAGSSFFGLWRAYRQSVDAVDRELGNLAHALSEQTAWTSEAFDLLLKDTAQWYATDGRAESKDRIDAVLADRAAGVRQVRKLTIANADGIQRYRSDGSEISDVNISNRSHFVALRDDASIGRTGLYITEPQGHNGTRNVVLLSRRIEDDKKNFLGVVTATVDLQDLKDLYGAVQLGPGNAVQLLRSDGILLVRNPPASELVGQKFPQMIAPADASPLRLTSSIDGSREFAAIAPVRDAPLVLTVTRQESVALGSWRDEAGRAILRTIGLTLLGALTVMALVRQLNRIEAGERALRESHERQAQSQRLEALGSLAGGIAHDFNNILGSILGYGELAQQHSPEGGAVRRYVDNVMHGAERAKLLVDRILGFSRSGMSERVLTNIQAVVEETLDLLKPSLPEQIRFERKLAAGNVAVIGDATDLHQVVMNLCTNAVQAMQSGGTLSITLERAVVYEPRSVTRGSLSPGEYALLTVRDTGSGIPRAVLDRVFDPFFTTKGVGAGTGLGLSLVDGIVQDLGGAIAVATKPAVGTTFSIWLPVAGEAARSAGQPATELAHGKGETVMIVDDEPTLVALAEEVLAGVGYEPVGFDSSAAALQAFRLAPQRFDLILTDENMPGLTGTELTRELRKARPDIPVILMSGYGGPHLAERAAAVGISELIRKPLQRRELSEALARILRSAQAQYRISTPTSNL